MRSVLQQVILILCGWLVMALTAQAEPAADPMDATVFITVSVEGKDASGQTVRKPIWTGTGFIIHEDGWVATAKHLLDVTMPEGGKLIIEGRIRSGNAGEVFRLGEPPLFLKETDITLLTLPSDLGRTFPYLCLERHPKLTIGRPVVAYGFPLGGNNARREGEISSSPTDKGLVLMSGGLEQGMSGGPVMADNAVIGVITEGLGQNAFDFFTPVNLALPHFDTPPAHFVGDNCGTPPPPPPEFIERAYRIDETNDDHDHTFSETTRTYTVTQQADPGYRIIDTRLDQESATRVSDIVTNVSADRQSVTLTFKLTAGPTIDQYRGWLHANFVLKQQRQ